MTSPTTANSASNAMTSLPGATSGQMPSFLERLASQIGLRAGATSIVGAPVERDGVTVVPLARASWGFGGGGGSGGQGKEAGEGSGGGGGASVHPVGYIEIKNGATSFHPVVDPNTALKVAATLATAFSIAMVLRVLGRVVRGK